MQKSRYSRMHLLPGLLGWLITISLMDGGLWAIKSWLTLTGQTESVEYASVVSSLFSGASHAGRSRWRWVCSSSSPTWWAVTQPDAWHDSLA